MICFYFFQHKVNIKEQFPKYLLSEVKLLTTKCALIEAEKVAKKITGALIILRQFGVHECGHRQPVGAAECLKSMIGKDNSSHYIIATQDRALQDEIRNIPGVPLIYLHLKSPTLDKLSDASMAVVKSKTETTFSVSDHQDEMLKKLKESSGIVEDVVLPKKKRKKKGPNPLSCLKKKKTNKKQSSLRLDLKPKEKVQKRRRKKLPAHIKETLLSQINS